MGLTAHKSTRIAGATLVLLTVFAMLYLAHSTLKSNLRHPALMVEVFESPQTCIKSYLNTGNGWNESESSSKKTYGTYKFQPIRMQLPRHFQGLRIDPSETCDPQEMRLYLGWFKHWTSIRITPEMATGMHQIQRIEKGDDGRLIFTFEPGCNDPHFIVSAIPESLQLLEAKRIQLLTTFRFFAGIIAALATLLALLSFRKP